jgi:PTS system fructose-specific IIA component/PTS system nitrogen regulatory IIA component
MKLSDFVTENSVVEELKATGKEAAIRELVGTLRREKRIAEEDAPDIVEALLRREELGSTGIGRGIAVPHTKNERVRTMVGAFGRSSTGIEFHAIDGQPVHCIFLLLSPKDAPREHMDALRAVTLLVRDDGFCQRLREAAGAAEITALLREPPAGENGE